MELAQLRHIVAVDRHRSFSRAAEDVGITQPALSRSIAAFEQRHGVILFDRGRGGVYPTSAGMHVIDQARKMLTSASNLERSLKFHPGGEAGRIAMGLGPLLGSMFLPQLGSALLRAYPSIQIVTQIRTPSELIADLLGGKIEVILGNNWDFGRVPGTDMEMLGALNLAVMVRAGHPLVGKPDLGSADLEAYPVASAVELPPGSMKGGAGVFVSENYHVLRETVLLSDCIWLSSPAFVAGDLRAGDLVQIDVADMLPAPSPICLISQRDRTRSTAMAAAIETIRELLLDTRRQGA